MPIDTRPVITTTGTGESCPYCRSTGDVQPITGTSPVVQAWWCTACGTNWAITSNHAYLVDLGAAVEEIGRLRWTLAQVIALADDSPTITDVELRARLQTLVESGAR